MNKSTIGRKVLMALSGMFLLVFLLQHLVINSMSLIGDGELFNNASHFMGTNPVVQFLAQPLLIFGVVFHLAMGMVLEYQNNKAREVKYVMSKPSTNSPWTSRNMIISGIMVMLFLGLHFYDFWLPEVKTKFIDGDWSGMMPGVEGLRYFTELQHKFESPVRTGIYVTAFIFLSLHLLHGFQSSFQSVGFNHNKYTPLIKKLSNIYAILIPTGFVIVALFHHLSHYI